MRKFTTEEAATAMELQQLVMDYWRDVDFNDAQTVPDFFTEDCVYVGGPQLLFKGREGLRKFYDNVRMTRDRARVIRHTITNVHVATDAQGQGIVNYTVVSYAKSGTPPIPGLTGPSQVTDIHLLCRRDQDGIWRIAEFTGAPIFVGADSMLSKLPKN